MSPCATRGISKASATKNIAHSAFCLSIPSNEWMVVLCNKHVIWTGENQILHRFRRTWKFQHKFLHSCESMCLHNTYVYVPHIVEVFGFSCHLFCCQEGLIRQTNSVGWTQVWDLKRFLTSMHDPLMCNSLDIRQPGVLRIQFFVYLSSRFVGCFL